MSDRWFFKSASFASCNCDANCGCQFNLGSTHGSCEFVAGGLVEEGRFNGVTLDGLKWAFVMKWPGEIPEGNGRGLVVVDESGTDEQREAMRRIVCGEAGEPGSNHFSVFASTCSEMLEPVVSRIDYEVDIENRTARLEVPGVISARGAPIVNHFNDEPFRIALHRETGSFEFVHAEIGAGSASVEGPLPLELDNTYAQFCIHHYDQDGLVRAA